MSVEKRGNEHRVRYRRKNAPRFQISVRDEALANALDEMLEELHGRARRDILEALARRELDAETVWTAVKVRQYGADGVLKYSANITPAVTVQSLKAFHMATGVALAGGPPAALGVVAAVPRMTLEQLLDDFRAEMRSGQHLNRRQLRFAPSTIERYEDSFNAMFAWDATLRGKGLDALTETELASLRVARLDAGATSSTANRDYDAIQSFFTWLEKRRPQYAPAARPKPGKLREPDPRDRAMTEEHFELWHGTLQHHPELENFREFRPIFALTGSCALRIDEGQGLRRCDIEKERGRPAWAVIVEYDGHTLKSPGAERTVGLTDDVIPMIEERLAEPGAPTDPLWPERLRDYHKAQYAFEKTCVVAGLHDEGKHYLTQLEAKLKKQVEAGELTKKGMNAALDRAKANVPRAHLRAIYTMHSLRHTLATRLEQDGMNLNDLRLLLGQAMIETTMRYIGKKLTKKMARAAASRSVRVMPFAPTRPASAPVPSATAA